MRTNAIIVKRSTFWTVLVLLLTVALILIVGAARVDAQPAVEACNEFCIEYETVCILQDLSTEFDFDGFCTTRCVETRVVCPPVCEVPVILLPASEASEYLDEPGASMLPLGVFRINCWGFHEANLNDFGLAGRTDLKVMCRTEDGGWTDDNINFTQTGNKFNGMVYQHGICGFFPS